MEEIYKYFIKKKKVKNSKDINIGLLQGLYHLNKRREYIIDLKDNFKYNNGVLIEGLVTTQTIEQKYSRELSRLNDADAEQVRKILTKYEDNVTTYNEKLATYTKDYEQLLSDYNELKYGAEEDEESAGGVDVCKANCLNSTPDVDSEEYTACYVGCELKSPYLIKCQNTFKDGDNTCAKAKSNQKCKDDSYKDTNEITAKDGCCECGGGKFGKPKSTKGGNVWSSCTEFSKPILSTICTNAPMGPENEQKINNLPDRYEYVVGLNNDMIEASKKIIESINELNEFEVKIGQKTQNTQTEHKNLRMEYDGIKDKIDSFTKKKKNTLNKRATDGLLKKQAYDFRNNIWTMLALALGIATIYKIKDL